MLQSVFTITFDQFNASLLNKNINKTYWHQAFELYINHKINIM